MLATVPMALTGCTDAQIDDVESGDGGRPVDARVSSDGRASTARPDAARDDAPDAHELGGMGEVPDSGLEPIMPLDATPPEWAAKLLGDYALRLRIFTREKTTRAGATHEIISAVQIFFDAEHGEVRMRLQMCDDIGDALGGLFKGALAFPHRYPERVLRLGYAQGEFFTDNTDTGVIGYSEEKRADCSPGAMVTRGPAQSWLQTGPCTCPEDYGALPKSKYDCRVTDPDGDGAPGLTIRITSASLASKDYVVTRDKSQVVGGKIANDQFHMGTYRVNQETVQVECPDGTCTTPEIATCPPMVNTAEFAPLARIANGKMWECPALLDAYKSGVAKLSLDPPKFPEAACP